MDAIFKQNTKYSKISSGQSELEKQKKCTSFVTQATDNIFITKVKDGKHWKY